MELFYTFVKLIFTMVQFSNIILSCILIATGSILFRHIRQVLHGFDKWIHLMVALHVLCSILILSVYEMESAEMAMRVNTYYAFAHQLSILTLLVINALFQVGIYKFFTDKHCDVCLVQNILQIIHSHNRVTIRPASAAPSEIEATT